MSCGLVYISGPEECVELNNRWTVFSLLQTAIRWITRVVNSDYLTWPQYWLNISGVTGAASKILRDRLGN